MIKVTKTEWLTKNPDKSVLLNGDSGDKSGGIRKKQTKSSPEQKTTHISCGADVGRQIQLPWVPNVCHRHWRVCGSEKLVCVIAWGE